MARARAREGEAGRQKPEDGRRKKGGESITIAITNGEGEGEEAGSGQSAWRRAKGKGRRPRCATTIMRYGRHGDGGNAEDVL